MNDVQKVCRDTSGFKQCVPSKTKLSSRKILLALLVLPNNLSVEHINAIHRIPAKYKNNPNFVVKLFEVKMTDTITNI